MTAPTKKAELTPIGRADQKRFVTRSALLNLIDPVRGEPTRTPLDENPDGDTSVGQYMKQNFLDSFALICSTSRVGAETASAVCLEQYAPTGAILRVARNRGLAPKDLTGLETVLQVLRLVARKESPSAQAESEILLLVAELDRDRILSMAEKVEKLGIRDCVREARSRLLSGQVRPERRVEPELRHWLESCPFMLEHIKTWNSTTLVKLVLWAAKARWSYPQQFHSLLGLSNTQRSPWLDGLHKTARYFSAVKFLVKLAAKQPGVFQAIQIQEVKAPERLRFTLGNEQDCLQTAVRSLVKEDAGFVMEQLEKCLETQDVEAKLRNACRLSLTLHAEMQLVVFYEGNPTLTPQMLFIGASKKACFLCHEYLLRHPLKLRVSACHQKIYPSWMPPPYYPVPGKYKNQPFVKLGDHIEQLTRRELKTALTAPRRPKNQDSTAGPSLTMTTIVSLELRSSQQAILQSTLQRGSVLEYLK